MQQLTKFKKTEVGEIPEDWSIVKFGEVTKRITYGFTNPMPHAEEGPWLITAKDIKHGRINYETAEKTTSQAYKQLLSDKSRPGLGTVLITKDGTLGEVGIVDREDICINQSVASLEPTESISSEFLALCLQSPITKRIIEVHSPSTTIKHISITDLAEWKFGLPPPEEQQKIASILSEVDTLIQKTDQIIEQTQRLKKGLMQKLLTDGNGQKILKSVRFGPLHLIYNIPDTWQVLTLKQCVHSDTPITYGIVQAGPHIPSGIPYIRTGDMSGGKLLKDNMLCTSKEIASSFQRSQVKAGEIVCALRGIVGVVLEVPKELEGANLTQGTARIAPHHDIYRRYLLWALRSEYARRQFEIFSKGTTLSEITLERLRDIKVAIPSDINEQKDIAHTLDQMESTVSVQQRYKKKVMMLKAGLMQKLLTGKIRVKA